MEESEEEVHVHGGEKKEEKRKEIKRHVWMKTNKEIKGK